MAPRNLQSDLDGLRHLAGRLSISESSADVMQVASSSLMEMVAEVETTVFVLVDSQAPTGNGPSARQGGTPFDCYVYSRRPTADRAVLDEAIHLSSSIMAQSPESVDTQLFLAEAAVIAPLRHGAPGEGPALLGCLCVKMTSPDTLSEEHRGLFETIAHQAAMALGMARLRDELQRMAITDRMTGLFSSRMLQEKLREEVEAAVRYLQPLSLLLIDADHLLRFNDAKGQDSGDALLKEMAALLKGHAPNDAIVARHGGDEFALLLKNTGADEASRLSEIIREAVQARFDDPEVPVTASIGLACCPEDARCHEQLLAAASDALYASKRAGRNRVSRP